MANKPKNILDYVGDDGEFLYEIDEYAEDMLEGNLSYLPKRDDFVDLTTYYYPFHGSISARWQQFVEYHAMLQDLHQYEINKLGWLAQVTYTFRKPTDVFILALLGMLFFGSILLGLILPSAPLIEPTPVTASINQDIVQLSELRTDILKFDHTSANADYQSCDAVLNKDYAEVPVYNVAKDNIILARNIELARHLLIQVRVPQNVEEWYQLDYNNLEVGENIVLAKYISSLLCK